MITEENMVTSMKRTNQIIEIEQLLGFRIDSNIYSISVIDIQEVIMPSKLTEIPSSPPYIKGLVNLRGQIVTAIDMRVLLDVSLSTSKKEMYIIVKHTESLYALVIDEILDVIDVHQNIFEPTPSSLPDNIKKYTAGVYKLKKDLLIKLDLQMILT